MFSITHAIKFKYHPDQTKVKLTAIVLEENFTVLGYYEPRSGNSLLTFWDNLLVPSSVDGTDRLFPKHRQKITTTHSIITQKCAVLIDFTTEA